MSKIHAQLHIHALPACMLKAKLCNV